MTYDIVFWLSMALMGISIVYFLTQSDEVPILMTLLYLSTGLYRYYVVAINPNNLKVGWVNVAYARSIFTLDNDLALRALNLYLLGTGIFVISYMAWRWIIGPPAEKVDIKPLMTQFMVGKRTIIIALFAIIMIAVFYSRVYLIARAVDDGYFNSASGVSYLLFLPFAISGITILMFLIFRSVNYQTDPTSKIVFGGFILLAAWLSYNPGARFNFLSWVVVIGILLVRDRPIHFKLRLFAIGGTALLFIYSIAGLARTPGAFALPFDKQVDLAIERLETAEDQNLLDGFMMVLQVYPENLDYQYGFQHLEILLRPIPRAIWPDKPVGGYANKLGLNDYGSGSGLTVGISETIYGTFYGEGGEMGIVLLSFLYGAFFAGIMRRAERFDSDMRWLIKGMVVSSLVALIRGGDLAGIVAFVGMAYWPVFIFMRQYGNFVRRFDAWYVNALKSMPFRRPEEPAGQAPLL